MFIPQDVRQEVQQHCGSNSKSTMLWTAVPDSALGQSGGNYSCGEDKEDGQDSVALPLGPIFVGVDVDVRHADVGHLEVRAGRGRDGAAVDRTLPACTEIDKSSQAELPGGPGRTAEGMTYLSGRN